MAAIGEEAVFQVARQINRPDARVLYLDQVCGSDAALRARVDALLRAYDEERSFLESPAVSPPGSGAGIPTAAYDAFRPEAGTMIAGRYKLLEEIGEGGMGTVWMAQQTEPLKRLVAVKLIKAGMDSRQVIARFEAERQALALMDHPNIARVLDGGTTDAGRPYFVMDLVKGVPITKHCDEHRLTPRQRLELFIPVCHAIQHAHQKGIIHRDLKPSNVLVALYDGKPVPKVIDFGVAKAAGQPLTEQTLVTGFGAIVGTLEYMSPEQAEINQLDIDTRSDVYALGVVLYELLTGTTPLESKRVKQSGMLEALRIIREEEVPTLSNRLATTEELPAIAANRGTEPAKLTKLVRGELDWIVTKALEKDRNRRYETATSFAADIQRYLADEPVQACPPSAWYRFGKFARRNRREVLIAGATAAVAVTGVVGLAVSNFLISREQRATADALELARVEVYFQRITVAHRELSLDNLAAALRALQECSEDLRGWEWYFLMRLCKVDPLVIRVNAEVRGLAFSPDGERLVSAGGDGAVRIWNSRTGQPLLSFPAHEGAVVGVAFHPEGVYLASRGEDKKVKVWNLAATRGEEFGGPFDVGRHFGMAHTVAFSPNGRLLATGSDGTVKVWDWKNRQLLHPLPGYEKDAISIAFSRDGRRLASASTGENVKLWDVERGGQLLRTFPAHGHPVGALAFSPDGERLAEANLNRCVYLWNTQTGERIRSLAHTGNVLGVAFSPDGRRLASSGEDKIVRVWDPTTGREVLGLRGHKGMCESVAFSPDGHRLASASTDGTIRVWDATPLRGDEGQELFTLPQNVEVRSVAFSPDGQRVAAAGIGTLVKTWNAATGEPGVEFDVHANTVFCLAWQPPDGRWIAAAFWDGLGPTVRVWDARDGRELFTLPPSSGCYSVAFSPDGRHLVTGRVNGAVQVWDAGTGAPIGTLGTHKREIRGLVFSPDGKHLASTSSDGEAKLWDAQRLREQPKARLSLPARVPGPSLNVAFSPDAQWLATGGEENTVKIWDVATGKPLDTLQGHSGDVYAVAVSPDGRWVASGGEDSTVKVWDSHNEYKLVRSFRGHTGLVASLAFSPHSRRLVSGSRDKTVKVWDVSELGQKQK